jgi:hypothetical protein
MVSLYELQQMDSDDFEHLVAEIWSAMGYDTQVTQGGADRGIDVIATNDSEKVLIQAKRYSSGNKVGAPKIREYSALYQQEGATDVVVVTTGEFTSNASELAPTIGVTTVNGDELMEMISDYSSDQQSDVASDVSSTSQQDDSIFTSDSPLENFISILLFPSLWEEADSVIIGIIVWFIMSPLLMTVAGLYAGVVILHAVLTMGTGGENEPTESEPSKQPDN